MAEPNKRMGPPRIEDGVLCARALAAAFSRNGAEGVEEKLRKMTMELRGAMANTGSGDLKHINSDSVILPV